MSKSKAFRIYINGLLEPQTVAPTLYACEKWIAEQGARPEGGSENEKLEGHWTKSKDYEGYMFLSRRGFQYCFFGEPIGKKRAWILRMVDRVVGRADAKTQR